MIYTNLIPPKKTVFGKFAMRLAFACGVDGFTRDNITLTGDIEGVDYRLYEVACGCTLQFKVPLESAGQFTVAVIGQVREATDTEEETELVDLEPVSAVVNYDTRKTIDVTFGQPVYKPNGQVALPVSFPEDIQAFTKNHLNVVFSEGKGKYLIYGSDSAFELICVPPRNRTGNITVAFAQPIVKANGITVSVNASPITIPYTEA